MSFSAHRKPRPIHTVQSRVLFHQSNRPVPLCQCRAKIPHYQRLHGNIGYRVTVAISTAGSILPIAMQRQRSRYPDLTQQQDRKGHLQLIAHIAT